MFFRHEDMKYMFFRHEVHVFRHEDMKYMFFRHDDMKTCFYRFKKIIN